MSGRCPKCEQPFDDHVLPKTQPLGTVLPNKPTPTCPPKKV